MITLSIGQVINWIIANRNEKTFQYNRNTIYSLITVSCQDNAFACSTNSQGQINGVVCGQVLPDNTVFIHDILVTEKGVVKKFLCLFNKTFPGRIIKGVKRGTQTRIFTNTKRVEQLL